MKNIFSILSIAAFALCTASCNKDKEDILQKDYTFKGYSYLKIVNAYTSLTPSAATPAAGPSVNVFVAGKKINGAAISYGAVFPIPSGYAAVPAGLNVNVKVVLNRATGGLPSDTLTNNYFNLAEGGYTTIFITDTLPNPTPQTPILLPVGESVTSTPAPFFYRMRFVNLIPSNDTLEVYSKYLKTVVFQGTKFKYLADWVELPLPRRNDTLELRKVGTTTPIATINSWNPSTQRIYTIYSRGSATGAPKVRELTSYNNR